MRKGGERSLPSAASFTLLAAFGLAALMFVVAPHLLSLGMQRLDLGGDMEGFTFHMWDGLFKFFIFIGYIAAVSFVPEIRRVFQYHGAEHKVIAALEAGEPVSARSAMRHSRLHARCGTTFMLFVLSAAVLAHAAAVPSLLALWAAGKCGAAPRGRAAVQGSADDSGQRAGV